MISYKRADREWTFDPLPVSRNTGKLFSAMAALKKDPKNFDAISELLVALPEAIERSMRNHHGEDEINAFIDTITLDFGQPDSLSVLKDINQLFMGVDPATVTNEQPAAG